VQHRGERKKVPGSQWVHPRLICDLQVCVCGTGVWTQDFTFGRSLLDCLSHTSSPFTLVILEIGLSLFSQAALDYSPLILSFPQLLGWQVCTPHSALLLLLLRWYLANFWPRLAPNHHPPNFSLPSS
jgi:hypothetical protein